MFSLKKNKKTFSLIAEPPVIIYFVSVRIVNFASKKYPKIELFNEIVEFAYPIILSLKAIKSTSS